MVDALVEAIAKFGLPTVAAAVLLYILIQGDLTFRYPRRSPKREDRDDKIDSVSSRRKLAGAVLYWVTVRDDETTQLVGNPRSFRTLKEAESKKFELEEALDPSGRHTTVAIEPLSTVLNLMPPEFLKPNTKIAEVGR